MSDCRFKDPSIGFAWILAWLWIMLSIWSVSAKVDRIEQAVIQIQLSQP